jgi:fermentation-respiration switch protein FrsA (DUF1100 family)
VPEIDILLLGRSLGGGVAVDLASQDGARGLVLESTFSSLPDVARQRVWTSSAASAMTARLDSAAQIKSYHGPLLQSHGDRDEVIALEVGKKLFAAANQPKQFVLLPGATHNSPPPVEYYRALDQFLSALPAHGQTPARER